MKKVFTGMMAFVLLAFFCLPAMASEITVDERFFTQVKNYAVKGTVSFAVSGTKTAMIPDETFQMLKSVLPQVVLNVTHSVPGGGQVAFADTQGEEKYVDYVYDQNVVALHGNVVTEDETWYAAELELSRLLALFSKEQGSALPGMMQIYAAFEKADDQWKEEAAVVLSRYETAVSLWMNQYAGTAMGKDGETLYSQLSCNIPADALKAEIKGLLKMLYGDEEALALLGDVLAPLGGSLYLNPAMESVFAALVDGLPLEGEVEVLRRFDAKGSLVLDKVALPLHESLLPMGGAPWQKGSLEMTAEGLCLSLEGAAGQGLRFSAGKTESGYAGQLMYDDQESAHVGFDYALEWQAMDEVYTLQTDLVERMMQGTLTLTPDAETALPPQRITLDLTFTSRSAIRTATRMVADVVWMDRAGDASIAMTVNLKTAGAFDVQPVAALEDVMFFSDMPADERTALLLHILLAPLRLMQGE